MVSQNVSRSDDMSALIACLVIAVVFVIMRTGARWFKNRTPPLDLEDWFMYLALTSFVIMVALYLDIIPVYFKVEAIAAGTMAPYATFQQDLLVMLKEFFVVQFFFWLTLWAVKWSLLFLFKRLTEGLPVYNQLWWAILVFSVLTFIGCAVSNFTSCSSMHAWFTVGECQTERDARAKAISLWFSLGADLATDLLIMPIPLRVLWTLKISAIEKLSIAVVFVVGILTMITAIIRSVSLNSSTTSGQVSTTWLMMWAAIEGCVAIVVGCLPSFAIFIKGRVIASRARNYDSSSNTPRSLSYFSSRRKQRRVPLSGNSQSHNNPADQGHNWHASDVANDAASDKGLVGDGIVVTQSWSQQWHSGGGQTRKGGAETHEMGVLPAQRRAEMYQGYWDK